MKINNIKEIIFKYYILIWISICVFCGIISIGYAVQKDEDLNMVNITIENDGSILQDGNLFGEQLWYPGMKHKGIIRIKNQYKSMTISNIGIQVKLDKYRNQYEKDTVYNEFMKNMKFTNLSHDILKNKNFSELEYREDDENLNGYTLKDSEKLNIRKNDSIDLKYMLQMDEEAGNELQELSAKVLLLINVNENIIDDPNPQHHSKVRDIDKHWAHDCIQTLLDHGIIQGYPDKTIRPDNNITRAEAAVLIANALKLNHDYNEDTKYVDVIPAWAKGHVIAVSEAGIFEGYLDNTFRPNNNITREEMLAVLVRGFKKKLGENFEIVFKDRDDISDWAIEYVEIGASKKIIVGYPNNTFKPLQSITRAESFTIICKLLGYHPQHDNEILE